jgi:hypothetical protein
MIIRTHKPLERTTIEYQGDKTIVTHNVPIDGLAKANADLRKLENNGFSQDREFRLIGRIPLEALLAAQKVNDNLKCGGDIAGRELKKLIKLHQEYKTVGGNI